MADTPDDLLAKARAGMGEWLDAEDRSDAEFEAAQRMHQGIYDLDRALSSGAPLPSAWKQAADQAAVDALIKVVEDYVRERRRLGGGYDLPKGLCLEMHPRVRHMIMRNWQPDYRVFVAEPYKMPLPAEVPVKINPDLPDNTWRLAVITVEVIIGGKMPDA